MTTLNAICIHQPCRSQLLISTATPWRNWPLNYPPRRPPYSVLFCLKGALRSGKTHKQIWQRLCEAGLDITCETFCRLVRRARKKPRTSAARGEKSLEVPELHARQTAAGVKHDPLVNLRRIEVSRPGFHYRGTENLDVLVYGRKESCEQSKR